VAFNRAGPDESCLSVAALLHVYGHMATRTGEDDSSNHEGR